MDATKSLLTTIARQIETARTHAGIEERRGEDAGSIQTILRSLRMTYLALATGLDPRKDAIQMFVLDVGDSGKPVLRQGGHPVPVNVPYLEYLFWTAGVELAPPQILLIEPELASTLIEEALMGLALEQALAERERAQRRAGMEDGLSIPGEEELEAIRSLEFRTSALWERKIELVAASLVAAEFEERARALSGPSDPGTEAA